MKTWILGLVGVCSLAWLSSGTEAWQATLSGTATSSFDTARAVAADAAGDIVAAGDTENTDTGQGFTVLKLDGASGAERWRQVINGSATGFDQALAVTVDAAGDVVAAGFITNSGTLADFTVLKLDGVSGAERWRQVINGSTNINDGAFAVAVDAAGDVVAAGSTVNSGTGSGFTVIKFDGASGAEQWRQVINGPANGFDRALAVTVDAAGDVVAAGVITNTGTELDFTVIKFSGASGAERWRQVINVTANSNDVAFAVAVDAAGDVVAAGRTESTSAPGFIVVKLRGTDGRDFEASACVGTGVARLQGRVRAADRTGFADVTLRLRGPGDCRETTTTNAQGHYVFRTLDLGTYTVTPAKDGCTFTPADRTVTIAARVVRARFRGTCP
jgi:hypothetical protein